MVLLPTLGKPTIPQFNGTVTFLFLSLNHGVPGGMARRAMKKAPRAWAEKDRLGLELHRALLNAARLSRLTQVGCEGHVTETGLPNQLEYGSHGLSAVFHHQLQIQNQVHHHGGVHLPTTLLRSVKGVIRGIKSASRWRGREFCRPAESRREMESSGEQAADGSTCHAECVRLGLLMYGSMTLAGCRR